MNRNCSVCGIREDDSTSKIFHIQDVFICLKCLLGSHEYHIVKYGQRLEALEKWKDCYQDLTGDNATLEAENAELRKDFGERMTAFEKVNADTNIELRKYKKLVAEMDKDYDMEGALVSKEMFEDYKKEAGVE